MVKYNTDYNTKYNTNYNTIFNLYVNLHRKNKVAIWEYVHHKCIICFLFILIIQLLLYIVHIN